MYHPPSQSCNTFKDFVDNFELNLGKVRNKNPYLFLVVGDFNVKWSNRYKLDKKTYGGFKIDEVTSQFRLQQLIKEPNHILAGVYSPLHENCDHQMRSTNINLIVCYLPSIVKYGIINVRMLVEFNEQLNSFLRNNCLEI